MIITREGKTYQLTIQELEAAYRERERMYKAEDAKRQLLYFAGVDDTMPVSSPDFTDAVTEFEKEYGRNLVALFLNDNFIDCLIDRYEDEFDCNCPENITWENVIKNALAG